MKTFYTINIILLINIFNLPFAYSEGIKKITDEQIEFELDSKAEMAKEKEYAKKIGMLFANIGLAIGLLTASYKCWKNKGDGWEYIIGWGMSVLFVNLIFDVVWEWFSAGTFGVAGQ